MEEVVVLDFGSDTFKAGPVHNFPNEAQPRIVSTHRFCCSAHLQLISCDHLWAGLQVTPAAVQIASGASGGADASDSVQTADGPKDAARVVQAGQITHWEGFEALISNVLYDQVRCACSPATNSVQHLNILIPSQQL